MGVIAIAVQHMLAGGMAPEAIVRAVAEMEGATPVTPETPIVAAKSPAALRQQKWRNRQKAQQPRNDGVTGDADVDTAQPLALASPDVTASLLPPVPPPPLPTPLTPTPFNPPPPSIPSARAALDAQVDEAFAAYQALAERTGLAKVRDFTAMRRAKLRARIEKSGLEAYFEALNAVEVSRHCRGQNDRLWKADFDFILQEKSWNRLLEGSYGRDYKEGYDDEGTGSAASRRRQDERRDDLRSLGDAALAAAARRGDD